MHSGEVKKCKNGHERTSENTLINSNGHKMCKTCIDIYRKKHAHKLNKWDGVATPPQGKRRARWGEVS